MLNKRILAMSAATAGLLAIPATSAEDSAGPAAAEVAGNETIQLSVVLAKGGG